MRSLKNDPSLSQAQRDLLTKYGGTAKTYPVWFAILATLGIIAVLGEGGRLLYPEQTPAALANVAHFIINCLVFMNTIAAIAIFCGAVAVAVLFTWLADPAERKNRGFPTHKKIWEGFGENPDWLTAYKVMNKLLVVALLVVMAMGGWYVRGMIYLLSEVVLIGATASIYHSKVQYLKSLSDEEIQQVLTQDDFQADTPPRAIQGDYSKAWSEGVNAYHRNEALNPYDQVNDGGNHRAWSDGWSYEMRSISDGDPFA